MPYPLPSVESREFGRLADGRVVHEYTLRCGGITLSAITLGGIVTRLLVPDRHGELANVVLGFDGLTDYVERNPNFGVIVGRYANRIANAQFSLDGQVHQLPQNDGTNCLHGGPGGFGTQLWSAEPAADGSPRLTLKYVSAAGEQGFPGCLRTTVHYTLGPDASWRIDYEAITDAPTVVNLSHHDYFNLGGAGSVLQHRLQLTASRYMEVGPGLIPSGVAPVSGTPFDFRTPAVIEARIRQPHQQLGLGRGYDHCWLLDRRSPDGLELAARLEDPTSGRAMSVWTTEPAIQFYSGNFLDGRLLGSGGQRYRQGDGLCLETQHAPDSPNRPDSPAWPSTVLRPGQIYRSATEHRFEAVS
ncbi:aldose epimerase family protein [Ideonella sp. DXS29W]|uniref:Aldose 1-epimerase n=1 Tax=Ideonella lacteola TaxID=2984193 RepID=A0ABU9BNX9_9BURK